MEGIVKGKDVVQENLTGTEGRKELKMAPTEEKKSDKAYAVLVGWQNADPLVDKIVREAFEQGRGQVKYKKLERRLHKNIGYSYLIPTSREGAEQLSRLLRGEIYRLEDGIVYEDWEPKANS